MLNRLEGGFGLNLYIAPEELPCLQIKGRRSRDKHKAIGLRHQRERNPNIADTL